MAHLICYDISNNSLRSKIGKKIIAHGLDRINKSVYLGTITDTSLKELKQIIKDAIIAKGMPNDSVVIIAVANPAIQAMQVYGKNELDKDELTGVKDTMIV